MTYYTLIEGKLEEASHDPLHTQVVLREVEGGTHISLQDETGVFEEIDPPELEDPPSSELGSEEEEDGSEVAALRAEIEQLREVLEEHKGKTREMWRVNCEQIAEMDALLSEKEDDYSSEGGTSTAPQSEPESPFGDIRGIKRRGLWWAFAGCAK